MAKNLIPEIAKMLGVKVGEEFKIKDNTGTLDSIALNSVYAFIKQGYLKEPILTVSTGEARPLYMPPRPLEPISLKVFELLCRGKCEVVKMPWKPKEGQTVYSFHDTGISGVLKVVDFVWAGNIVAYQALLKVSWVFRTREEAKAALPKVAAELGVDYEL